MELYVGADIGGTSSKIALFDRSGQILDLEEGAGGNFRTAPGEAFGNIATTLEALLSRHNKDSVRAGHFGVAGAGAARYHEINEACQTLWSNSGVSGPLSVSSDLEIAYAAASSKDGLLLLAGTGAVACAFHEEQLVGRADGMGWILGDVGAGLWLGKKALEAAARELDRRGPATVLTANVLNHYGIDITGDEESSGLSSVDVRQELIARVYAQAPTEYGTLAPLVSRAFIDGDSVATSIITQGAAALIESLEAALHEGQATLSSIGKDYMPRDLVLAGTLLATDTPMRALVLELVESSPILRPLRRQPATPGIHGAFRFAVSNHG